MFEMKDSYKHWTKKNRNGITVDYILNSEGEPVAKRCTCCKEIKSLDCFYNYKRNKFDGKDSKCKYCKDKNKKKRYEENKHYMFGERLLSEINKEFEKMAERYKMEIIKIKEHYEDEIIKTEEHYEKEIIKTEEHYEKEIIKIKEHYEKEIIKIKEHYEDEIIKIKEHYEKEISKLKDEINQLISIIQDTSNKYVKESNSSDSRKLLIRHVKRIALYFNINPREIYNLVYEHINKKFSVRVQDRKGKGGIIDKLKPSEIEEGLKFTTEQLKILGLAK